MEERNLYEMILLNRKWCTPKGGEFVKVENRSEMLNKFQKNLNKVREMKSYIVVNADI